MCRSLVHFTKGILQLFHLFPDHRAFSIDLATSLRCSASIQMGCRCPTCQCFCSRDIREKNVYLEIGKTMENLWTCPKNIWVFWRFWGTSECIWLIIWKCVTNKDPVHVPIHVIREEIYTSLWGLTSFCLLRVGSHSLDIASTFLSNPSNNNAPDLWDSASLRGTLPTW